MDTEIPNAGTVPSKPGAQMKIQRAHWNMVSDCNLSCSFCYLWRREGVHIFSTEQAITLIDALAAHVEELVFGGGDPLMRPDIITLVERARFHGLFVEMHTNAKMLEQIDYRHLLPLLDRLGLSLDGEIPAVHDMLRAEPGNFESNLRALELASALNVPTTVRTLASRRNLGKIAGLAAILDRYACVEKWSIREFAPLGRGAKSRRAHELLKEDFQAEVNSIAAFYSAHRRAYTLAVVSEKDMADCYCLITEDGVFYGHAAGASDYRRIGAFPQDKIQEILSRLCYDRSERDRTYCTAHADTKRLRASLT